MYHQDAGCLTILAWGGNLEEKDFKKKKRKHAFDQEKSKFQQRRKKTRYRKKEASIKIFLFFFYKFPPLWSADILVMYWSGKEYETVCRGHIFLNGYNVK